MTAREGFELLTAALENDKDNYYECLEENENLETDFLLSIYNDPQFKILSLGARAALVVELNHRNVINFDNHEDLYIKKAIWKEVVERVEESEITAWIKDNHEELN